MKQAILGLLARPLAGAPLRAIGRLTWQHPKLLGLSNPFHVPGFVCERDGSRYIVRPGSYLAGLRDAVRFPPDAFEPEVSYLSRSLIGPDDIVLDIGANVGAHTVAFARMAKRVHAFEPVAEMADRLEANVAFNGLRNVTLHRHALGSCADTLPMQVNVSGKGMEGTSSLAESIHVRTRPQDYICRPVPVRRLDDLRIEGRIGFVKIDTEGFETQVIEGGLETIRKHRPAMIVEAHSRRLEAAGESFRWYIDTFPDYRAFIVYGCDRVNPYLRLAPLVEEPPEIAVNLLLLPSIVPATAVDPAVGHEFVNVVGGRLVLPHPNLR